ncbi:sialidase family protein [Actinopolymorpha sp. B17G11]|uniref:sialidase family protein n=1 Tax=Actinopolymorpha sp. B17G11 TaxID=3160861 RepID=UPI0032E4AE8B
MRRRDLLKTIGLAGSASMFAAGMWSEVAHAASAHALERVTVFERGETADYHTFRIPLIVRAADGTLLAFAQGRVDSAEDFGHIQLVLKRSADGGRTWGPLQLVAADPPNRVANQSAVVDQVTGRIHLFVVRTGGDVTGDDIANDRVSPEDAPRPFVMYSDDHGVTWSDWREITSDVKVDGMRHYVGGPTHGIQLTTGPHAGRLLMPGNHNFLPQTDERPAVVGVHVIYSDDHGESWQIGGAIGEYDDGIVVPNETAVVELADGTVYFNTRNQRGTAFGNRAATTSSDGGATFDGPFQIVPDLITPIVSGSLLEATRRTDKNERTIFAAPAHPSSRERLTLRSSLDGAASWRESLVVYDGPSGYSDLVEIVDEPSSMLGVYYENGPRLSDDSALTYHKRLSFARVPMELLDVPIPSPSTTPEESGHGNTAVVSGRPRLVAGKFGRALHLAGDYVEIPLDPSIDLGDNPFTVALWFRTSDQRTQRIANAFNFESFPQWLIDISPARLRCQVRTETALGTAQLAGNFADGNWHHVAMRRGDQQVLTLYLDGEPVATADAPVGGSVSARALAGIRIGARMDGINNPFVGTVDEAYLFDRALTAAQIRDLTMDNTYPAGTALVHLPLEVVQ